MELLSKYIKRILLVSLVSIPALWVQAQDVKKVQEAFTTSYSYESNRNYTKAIEVLLSVWDEESYETTLRLGWLTYKAGRYNESVNYYSKAITLRPYSVEARLGYVQPASAMGNWDQVLSRYNEIIRIDAGNYTARYNAGLIFYNRKDYQSAFKHFEVIVNMYPFDYDATHLFAWTNYRMGKLREAKVLFQKALLIRPNDSSCNEGLGLIK
jgi:tetratricopeptide (TPR) repeat protein